MAFGLNQARAGLRDRQILILKRTLEYNDLGEPVETWAPGGKAWAQVKYKSVSEVMIAGGNRSAKLVCFIVMWRNDLFEYDRIQFDNLTYQIIGLSEMGRRELLEIECERMEGQSE